jgi:hypothetical protein
MRRHRPAWKPAATHGSVTVCAGLVLIALALTGCRSGAGHLPGARPTSSSARAPAGPPPSLPPGLSQPFALLHVQQIDALTDLVNHYQDRCQAQHGHPADPAPYSDSTFGFIFTLADYGQLPEEVIRQRGFHPGPATTESDSRPVNRGDEQTQTACTKETDRRLGGSFAQFMESIIDLRNRLMDPFFAGMHTRLLESDAAEHRCAVKRGWTPVRPDDVDDPDASLFKTFGIPSGRMIENKAAGTQTYIPSPREVDLAVTLLHCREDLQIPQKLLAAAKQVQLSVIGPFELEILEINGQIDALLRKAGSVLR